MNKKHKNSYKTASLALILAMALSGCASPNTPSDQSQNTANTNQTSDGETATDALTDGLETIDMDGFKLVFLNYDGTKYWWSRNRVDSTELTADIVNDSVYNRNLAIEQRFNADISELLVPSVEENLRREVAAGTTEYQVAMVNDQAINSCLVAGVLLKWNSMPGCNLDNPWWNKDANNVFQVNGKQYAAVGDFNLSEYSKSYLIYFNKDLYGTLNTVDDLYKMALDGNWTYDKFLSLSKQYLSDLDGSNTYDENDQYGIVGFPRVMYQQLITGAGIKYVDIDSSGNPYFAIPTSERAISIMQKISEEFGKTDIYYDINDSSVYMNMFSSGRVVFAADTMYDTEKYRYFEINIGMLPSPKWDESQDRYYSITVGGVVSALPKTLPEDEKEYTGMLMEAMAFASKYDTLPAYKQIVLQGKYANDDESSEMIDIIFESQTYDLGVTVWDIRGQYMKNIFENNRTEVASFTESIKKTTDKQIQATIDKVLDE